MAELEHVFAAKPEFSVWLGTIVSMKKMAELGALPYRPMLGKKLR